MSTTTPTQIRINTNLKSQANALFESLGTDMSGAVNIFLKQCVLRGGLPFEVGLPKYKRGTLEAMKEAKKISKDDTAKTYTSIEEFRKAMEA